MSERTPEQERFLRQLAQAVISVAERHPKLRGPFIFDEVELQASARRMRAFLAKPLSNDLTPAKMVKSE